MVGLRSRDIELVTKPRDFLNRKLVTQCFAWYSIARIVTTGMIDVMVAHVLRKQFNWTMQGIGLAFCPRNIATGFVAVHSVLSHLLIKRLPSFMKVMALLSAVGITLLFDLRNGAAAQVVMVKCMDYSCGYVSNAIADGVASRTTPEESDNTEECWPIVCQMMSIARFCCLFVAHTTLMMLVRNLCVCMLMFLSC